MAQTGMERSMTVAITKMIGGVMQPGYPATYQGRNAFSFNSIDYAAIDVTTMTSMSVLDYNERLTAFQSYVEAREVGLHFATDVVPGFEAYKENLTSCPID